jgi:hypothetical protein
VRLRHSAQHFRVVPARVRVERDHLAARVPLQHRHYGPGADPQLTPDQTVLTKTTRREVEVDVGAEAPLVDRDADLLFDLPDGLEADQRDRPAVGHRAVRAHEREAVFAPQTLPQHL